MIELKNIRKSFGKRVLFDNFSLKIDKGEFVVFSGVSGCGKTTLLNIIGALEPVDSGEVLVDGKNVLKNKNRTEFLKTKIGFLFQNFALVENKSVDYNLRLVKNDCRTDVTIEKALEIVGMQDKRGQKVYSLSGGEQQRVAIARLMIKNVISFLLMSLPDLWTRQMLMLFFLCLKS